MKSPVANPYHSRSSSSVPVGNLFLLWMHGLECNFLKENKRKGGKQKSLNTESSITYYLVTNGLVYRQPPSPADSYLA